MSLESSYTLLAPMYDFVIERPFRKIRADSLSRLPAEPSTVLVNGIGTGLDLPHLPTRHRYIGLDLTAAMLKRARPRTRGIAMNLVQGTSLALPFADDAFDHAVLHLILAIVPDPAGCLREAARVVKPKGSVLIVDKFLRKGQWAPLRRALNPLVSRLVTRVDVVFEQVLAKQPNLRLVDDRPVLFNGWIRSIRLIKNA
ncbi:MAG: class I SAM-dependent methyltransferase [Burkholderiales bacterium]|nr:class I SAM-dependent methyltransferase [Burkholderiales bacterium]